MITSGEMVTKVFWHVAVETCVDHNTTMYFPSGS